MGMFQHDRNPMFGEFIPWMLMVITALTIPAMLLPKPYLLWKQHQAKNVHSRTGHSRLSEFELDHEESKLAEEEEEHFELGEVCIHQVIETIEFVLGSISHTASYLRLWALSLAHQQLSLVFFQKFMLTAMAAGGTLAAVQIFFSTACFIGVSVCFLMGVDVLECFLHTLRLHWVEFQSKFFKGDGNKFEPYSHQRVIAPSAGQ